MPEAPVDVDHDLGRPENEVSAAPKPRYRRDIDAVPKPARV